jgi:hypothetical protein
VLSSSSSSRDASSHSQNMSLDLSRSSSFVPSQHRAAQSSHNPAQPEATTSRVIESSDEIYGGDRTD